ncbi:squalene cyclase [Pseudorhodoplanes sinuspersici]|nr:squalene cyclase [Pseudorhodoplanes sinuspersici]
MRDLTGQPDTVVAAERSRVASEGWGARLLDRQTSDGHWDDDQEHGWMTTIDALVLLKTLGVDPANEKVRNAIDLVQNRVTWWQLDGRPFFDGETEACINGRILAAGAYFGVASNRLLDHLLGEQLEDGGWNCEAPPSKRSSFHSTICVLEGLLEYEKTYGSTSAVTDARTRGQDYLLERTMLRSLTTGAIINQHWMRFAFPAVWHYDILRGLDYLRSASVAPDERVTEATTLVKARRDEAGYWPLDGIHKDHIKRLSFDIETDIGHASRWNTLRALRVLDWCSRPECTGGG